MNLGGEYSGGFSSGAQNGEGKFDILYNPATDDWEYFKGEYDGGYRKKGSYKSNTGDTYEGIKNTYQTNLTNPPSNKSDKSPIKQI